MIDCCCSKIRDDQLIWSGVRVTVDCCRFNDEFNGVRQSNGKGSLVLGWSMNSSDDEPLFEGCASWCSLEKKGGGTG